MTIRLDPDLERRLSRAARQSGRTRSEFVRDALRRQLAIAQLEDLRRRIMPFAEAQGYLTDEDGSQPVPILTPRGFWEMLRSDSPAADQR